MELLLMGIIALLAAGLTFFSGFGVGTILMPVFALFFPVPLAIAATAVVHFINNLFKFALMASKADWRVVAVFSIPAAVAAYGGALLLGLIAKTPTLYNYTLFGTTFEVTPVKAVIGALILLFALLELWPRFQKLAFPRRWLPVGGILSGFFGGLSGNQGALRSAFLIKAGLSKEVFVATGVVSAVIVDASRLTVYGTGFLMDYFVSSKDIIAPVIVATVCACAGSLIGRQVLKKVTLHAVRLTVATAMLLIGAGLLAGVV